MTKTLIERTIQYLIIAFSTAIAFFLIGPLVKQYFTAIDDRLVVAATTGLVYFALLLVIGLMLKITLIRKLFDDKATFVGQYLSFPKKDDELSVLNIKYDWGKQKYRLNGTTYSLKTFNAVGTWNSELLDIDAGKRRVTYIYYGTADQPKFDGHGYGQVTFLDDEHHDGSGHFFDDAQAPLRTESKYRRVRKDLTAEIAQKRWSSLNKRRRLILLRSFAALSDAKRASYRPS
jgi:hypothetical protein